MSIDPVLIGFWQNIDGTTEFNADAWQYTVGSSTFGITSDHQQLIITAPNGHTTSYNRTTGSGDSLFGSWQLTQTENGSLWIEEWTFSNAGTYTSTWTVDGQFNIISFGYFQTIGNALKTRERRGSVSTIPTGAIEIDRPFDADQSGIYVIDATGALQLTLDGAQTTLQPTPQP
jgi:hypothetical protein